MKRNRWTQFLVGPLVVYVVMSWSGGEPVFAEAPVPVSVFVELNASDLASMRAAVDQIESYGGICTHVFPFRGCIGELPTGVDKALSAQPEIAGVYRGAIDPADLTQRDSALDLALTVWGGLAVGQPAEASPAGSVDPPPPADDALTAPERPVTMLASAAGTVSTAPDFYQTSEFLAGSVAVGIVLPESNGAIDTNQESWSTTRQDNVITEIAAALSWWAAREPAAGLSFVYDVARSIPTSYEPINHSQTEEALWISDTMTALGHPGTSRWTQTLDYDNALRHAYGTDWAFTVFVVDDLVDGDNMFAPNANGTKYFAYAYLGGPFMVMTYGNDGYGPGNMDAVMAHEMGHIFQAQDGYSGSSDCSAVSGYLAVQNSNSLTPLQNACGMDMPCIMRGQIAPYTAGVVSTSARGQLGWRDSDADGILDPLDTDAGLAVWRSTFHVAGDTMTWNLAGLARDYAFLSPSRIDTTINTVQSVEYQVDGGLWHTLSAADGAWDEPEESFTFQTAPLTTATHRINVRVTNSVGNSISQVVVVFGPGPNDVYLPLVER